MQHFKYVNNIRKSDGILRNWQDHEALCLIDKIKGYITYHGTIDTIWRPNDKITINQLKRAIEIIDNEE